MTITPDALKQIHTFPTDGWTTDFSRHTVPYREISSGGPPKDGIPAIDKLEFVSPAEANGFLKDDEPVVLLELNGEARAYPLQILVWRETVNDTVGGEPVAITYCPLCNTAIACKDSFDGQTLDFGTTGNRRLSDRVMYDRQTESWWQQVTGEGIVGKYAGSKLEYLPVSIVSYSDFKAADPSGLVLSRKTGFDRPYGQDPYTALFSVGTLNEQLPSKERVGAVTLNGASVAYPVQVLAKQRVVNDELVHVQDAFSGIVR